MIAAVVLAVACDPSLAAAEAATLRLELVHEATRARQWNTGWGVGFGVASAAQLGLAASNWAPFYTLQHDDRVTLYAGAAKAGLGALGRLATPLSVDIPPLVADPCADALALHAALADAARLEHSLFWTLEIGGLVVNLAAAVIVAHETSLSVGIVSFAVSYPVGLLSVYTMPRTAWHMVRSVTPMPIISPQGAGMTGMGLSIGGEF